MNLKWEVEIVTPNMHSERSFFRPDSTEYTDKQYELCVTSQKFEDKETVKSEIFLQDVPLFDQDNFGSMKEAKDACVAWLERQTKKDH